MKTLELEQYGVQEMSQMEEYGMNGGFISPGSVGKIWTKIKPYIDDAITAIEALDALHEFSKGFNSVKCKN